MQLNRLKIDVPNTNFLVSIFACNQLHINQNQSLISCWILYVACKQRVMMLIHVMICNDVDGGTIYFTLL